MSKGVIIIAAAVLALALFWKPISDMLNGLVGGGGGFGDYFGTRDTSTRPDSTDPPKEPPKEETKPDPTPSKEPTTKQFSLVNTEYLNATPEEKAAMNKKFVEQFNAMPKNERWYAEKAIWDSKYGKKPADKPADETNLTQDIKSGAAWAAGYAIVTNAGKVREIPKAYHTLKEVAKKTIEKSPALINAAKNVVKSPAIRRGGIIAAAFVVIDQVVSNLTNKTPLVNALLSPEWKGLDMMKAAQNKGTTAPSTYTQPQQANKEIASGAVSATDYSPTASWRSSGFTTSGGVTSYQGTKLGAGITTSNLSPVIARAISASKGKK